MSLPPFHMKLPSPGEAHRPGAGLHPGCGGERGGDCSDDAVDAPPRPAGGVLPDTRAVGHQ